MMHRRTPKHPPAGGGGGRSIPTGGGVIRNGFSSSSSSSNRKTSSLSTLKCLLAITAVISSLLLMVGWNIVATNNKKNRHGSDGRRATTKGRKKKDVVDPFAPNDDGVTTPDKKNGVGGGNGKVEEEIIYNSAGINVVNEELGNTLVVKTATSNNNDNAHQYPQPPEFDKDGVTRLHLVFSTDCSSFQHWQSYLLFFSALKVGQPGKVTRIASGCSDEEGDKLLQFHNKHIRETMNTNFLLHLTPHFSSVKDKDGKSKGDYKFFNKPYGLKHWLEHGENMGIDPTTGMITDPDLVVILTDPDMVLLRPIGTDFTEEHDQLVKGPLFDSVRNKVRRQQPFAQRYGLGTQWQKFGLDTITNTTDSPSKSVTSQTARLHYPVGPPYIATAADMITLATKWSEFVPRVHAEYPNLLAEMYAFCIAAAHVNLPHQLIDSLMISNTGGGGEGWSFIDTIPKEQICDVASHPSKYYPNGGTITKLPNVFHYCQRYMIGRYFFGKRKVPHDIFTCNKPLFKDVPDDIAYKYDWAIPPGTSAKKEKSPKVAKREAFMICGLTSIANEASMFFKSHHCGSGGDSDGGDGTNTKTKTSYEKTLDLADLFPKPRRTM